MAGGFDSVHYRHIDTHEDDIGLKFAGQFDRWLTVFGLPDYLHVDLMIDQRFESVAEHLTVVCKYDFHFYLYMLLANIRNVHEPSTESLIRNTLGGSES